MWLWDARGMTGCAAGLGRVLTMYIIHRVLIMASHTAGGIRSVTRCALNISTVTQLALLVCTFAMDFTCAVAATGYATTVRLT